MSTAVIDLQQLVESVEVVTQDPLDRLSEAAATARHLGVLGDLLVDHFVSDCRGSGYSWAEIGVGLGVTRQALSDLVNESAGVSVEMAIRLSKAFGSTPETWLGMQMAYDLWQARSRAREIRVRSLRRLSA